MPQSQRVSLTEGAYTARSFIAAAQESLNLYAEKNPGGEDSPTTHYLTPGLTRLGVPAEAARVRGLYRATNGELFAAIGTGVYFVNGDWTTHNLGTIPAGTTPVKMGDNGVTMVVVDGSAAGWSVVLATHAFAAISDPSFYGSNFVETLDTFLLFDKPSDTIFYASDSNAITFDPLFFAAKASYPDQLAGIAVANRNIWLIGAQSTSEIWFDAGAADFPFQIMPGPFVEHGTMATYSIAKQGGSVFWLGQDTAGTSFVIEGANFAANKISTPAIEAEIGSYAVVSDAVGMCYEQLGHAFYWLKFPTEGKDWVYDLSTKLWHRRGWLNPATCEDEGHRAFCTAFAYGVNVVGDRSTGQLYMLDPNNVTDAGDFIERRRGWPHMMANGNRTSYPSFIADVQAGEIEANALPGTLASAATFPSVVTVVDTTFTAPDNTLLQDYFSPWALSAGDDGSQYTQVDTTVDGKIVGNVLTGSGAGTTSYLASGKATSADYIAQLQAIRSSTDAPKSGAMNWLIGRADGSNNGYKAIITTDGATYQAKLTVMGGATTTIEAGLIASGAYFQVYLSMQGSAIDMAVQRSTDGFWLSSAAAWDVDFAKCVSITDTTYGTAGNVLIGGTW